MEYVLAFIVLYVLNYALLTAVTMLLCPEYEPWFLRFRRKTRPNGRAR
jgi:hypothetical protein